MLERLARRLLARLPVQDIGDGRGSRFFNRYTLLKTRRGSLYLHEFFRGDADRCLHDHPWSFASLIVRGGYWEETRAEMAHPDDHYRDVGECGFEYRVLGPTETRFHGAGSLLIRSAGVAHRIARVRPGTWSLVLVGRKSRPWGFYTAHGWRAWVKGQGNPICETADAAKGGA